MNTDPTNLPDELRLLYWDHYSNCLSLGGLTEEEAARQALAFVVEQFEPEEWWWLGLGDEPGG